MEGGQDGIDFVSQHIRCKIDYPYILFVVLAPVHHYIDGVIHIIHKLFVIVMRDTSKAEPHILKLHNGTDTVVQVAEGLDLVF